MIISGPNVDRKKNAYFMSKITQKKKMHILDKIFQQKKKNAYFKDIFSTAKKKMYIFPTEKKKMYISKKKIYIYFFTVVLLKNTLIFFFFAKYTFLFILSSKTQITSLQNSAPEISNLVGFRTREN